MTAPPTPISFPADWRSALVLVPHPDDPEYGMAAAVAKWTAAGKTVRYALACRGEAGIEGMPPEQAGLLREAEQRRAAAIVGVHDLQFWDFPDGAIRDTPELRTKITAAITAAKPDVVVSVYGGPRYAPGAPNQRDHIEFAAAVTAAFDGLSGLAHAPRWLFQGGPGATHVETVDGYLDLAVAALAAHQVYLSVLEPHTPVTEQACRVIEMTTPQVGGLPVAGFICVREVAR